MNLKLDENWTTINNKIPLNDDEVQRYNAVLPSANQLAHSAEPYYCFFHFGMNTATNREWGSATETVDDFTITKIKPEQWIKAVKASGASGVILTCKHHDGFCLWNTGTTDFNVMNTDLATDVVKEVAKACREQRVKFGVYLSPWDMHEKCYATQQYNDFFVRQLTELLTNYGEIFEVWFDGAKGAEAKAFDYDWERYYKIIRTLQPDANIAICGPDIRWVGNEGGKSRKSEFSVVPEFLTRYETIEKNSQHSENDGVSMQKITSGDEDLGSREVLSKHANLAWYPAEVDVSIRKGWFFHSRENGTVKSPKKLMNIYLNSVGNNCTLLLNVPPSNKGIIHRKDVKALKEFGRRIQSVTQNPVIVSRPGKLNYDNGYFEYRFDSDKKLKYCVLEEDIAKGQRVEQFDLYLLKPNGKYKKAYSGTVIGSKKIIALKGKAVGALFVIRQSRSTPYIKQIGFYE